MNLWKFLKYHKKGEILKHPKASNLNLQILGKVRIRKISENYLLLTT